VLFDRILTAGLIAFDEIGSSGEAADAQTPKQQWDAAIAAKVAGGMTSRAAIQALQKEQPALYSAYRNGGR
jgi:hypothetical protein